MLKKVELNKILLMGRKIRFLKQCDSNPNSYAVKGSSRINGNLQKLKEYFEIILGDSRTSKEIEKLRKKLNRKYKKEERLKLSDAKEITEKVKLWEDRALNILRDKVFIETSSSGILNYSKLINGSNAFFDNKELKKISEASKKDFNDCCSCLLVGLSTPSALMALRIVEDVLKKYYRKKIRRSPNGLEWGTMTSEIKRLPNYDRDLITHLDNLRKNLRNKAMHPERRFKQSEMEEIFVTVIKTIKDLIR